MSTYFDLEDGDIGFKLSNDMLMNSNGNLMISICDNMALDLDNGKLHLVTNLLNSDN